MKFNKRTISILAVAFLFIGGASAGLVDYFATVSGTGTVDKAISVTGNDTVDFSTSDGVAPETYQEQLDLTNNNPDDMVDYTWDVTGDNSESYINAGVYQVSQHDLYKASYGASYTSIDDAKLTDYDVTVIPSYETVTYSVEVPSDVGGTGYAAVELTNNSGDKFHIGYDGSVYYKTPSETGTLQRDVENFEPYVSHSKDEDTFNLTVKRTVGFSQSFAVDVGSDNIGSYDYMQTEEALIDDINKGGGDVADGNGGIYYGNAAEAHQLPTVTDLHGKELSLEGAETETYNFVTQFTESTGSGSYTVTAKAVP